MASQDKKFQLELGSRLVEARKKAGISQGELAQRTGISQGTISKYEKGLSKPASDFLMQASKIFEMELGVLLGENPPQSKVNEVEFTPEAAKALGFDPKGFVELTAEQEADLRKAAAKEADLVLRDFVIWARQRAAGDPNFAGYLRYVLNRIKKEA